MRRFQVARSIIIVTILLALSGASLGQSAGITVEPLPPDLPLPLAPPLAAKWLEEAIILQPWRATQHTALTDVGDRPQRLRQEFGFNAIIVLPPAANNVGVLPQHQQAEEQFRAGVEAYRKAGYRLILYSSVTQSGLDPLWHKGHLELVHPEWSQRDAKGAPLTKYGHAWLCPNSPGLEYTIDYTERLARAYEPDAIMLDNNQFFYTDERNTDPATWTCYCDYCQVKFRDYVARRFGAERVRRLFNADPASLRIPTNKGPLRDLWIHWRNRVWAETNEAFRVRLRQVDPEMMFFANHQYDWSDGVLASDLQYEHEDVVLSESRELTSWRMSAKMQVGNALARGRPLWNYIGTFEEKDYTRLRPQEVVGSIVGASLAHGARPWIVYFGFQDSQGNYQARREMSKLLSWYATRPELFNGEPWTRVGVLVSPLNRNIRQLDLIPKHLTALLRGGVPVRALRDDRLSPEELVRFRVLTLENVICMNERTANTLAAWVRRGGTLVAVPDAGRCDELGRRRERSVLWEALGLKTDPQSVVTIGRGKLVMATTDQLAQAPENFVGDDTFRVNPHAGVEIVPYETQGRALVHLVRHEPVRGAVTLELPPTIKSTAGVAWSYAPGFDKPQRLTIDRRGNRSTITITEIPTYSVIVIE